MTREDVRAFAEEMTLTAELFAAPMSDARITAYYQALEDVPWKDLRAALVAARQCERWFPTPAALRELLGPSPEVLAASAFSEVWSGAGGSPYRAALESAALKAVEAMGGWGTFKEARTGTGAMLSAQFRKLYLAYAKSAQVDEVKQRASLAPTPQRVLEESTRG